jgi:hypothetical protein
MPFVRGLFIELATEDKFTYVQKSLNSLSSMGMT